MAITNGYATLDDLRADLGAQQGDRDNLYEAAIETASRLIEHETGRLFYASTATRYYTAHSRVFLPVDDLLSLSELATDPTGERTYADIWAATDYDLEPYNDPPYTAIRLTPTGTYWFPGYSRGVKITGSWGYSATTPRTINQACRLIAQRLVRRGDAIFGVVGASEMGSGMVIARIDPDVARLLAPYRHVGLA